MKKLTALVAFLSILNVMYTPDVWPDSPPTNIEASYSFVNNKLKNPGFEQGLYGWTASVPSTMTLEKTASLVDDGSASLKFVSTATGQTITGTAIPLLNTSGIASTTTLWTISCRFQTSNTDYLMQAVDQSGNVISSQLTTDTVPSSTNYTRYSLSYYLPSGTTSVAPRIKAQSAGTVHADKCYTGPAEGFNSNQTTAIGGQLVGSVQWSCSAGGQTQTATTAYQGFSACTTASYTASNPSMVAAPALNIPAAVLKAGAPKGRYRFEFVGGIYAAPTGSNAAYFTMRWNDNTLSSYETQQLGVVNGTSSPNLDYNSLVGTMDYSSADMTVDHTVSIQASLSGSTGTLGIRSGTGAAGQTANATINVYYLGPSLMGKTARFDNTPAHYAGYLAGAGGGWGGVTAGTFTDFSVATTSTTLTPIGNVNMNCLAESTKLPAITCGIPKVAWYHICATGPLQNATSGAGTFEQLTDGSNTPINGGVGFASPSVNGYVSVSACGDYYAASTGNITFKLRGAVASGTASILQYAQGPINWEITEKDAPSGAVAIGNTVTNSAGLSGSNVRLNFAQVASTGSPCSVSPCSPLTQGGSWIQTNGVTRTAAGTYPVAFSASEYSGVPACSAQAINSVSTVCQPQAITSSGMTVYCSNTTTASLQDGAFTIQCTGIH